jgi:geranylgeranylglycerol-phosphate geranylgeranyltransferase
MRAAAFVTILRPHNMLASALAVVAGAYVVARGPVPGLPVVAGLAALATGAGNILNDCFDLAVDRVNKPRRPLPAGDITRRAALAWYGVLSLVAAAGALWLVPRDVGALVIGWQAALALYARWCKRRLVAGNVLVAAVSSSAFFAGAMQAGDAWAALIPAAMAFAFVLCREVVKGAEDLEGDRRGGVRTFAVALGARRAGTMAALLMLALAALIPLPALVAGYRAGYLLVMAGLVVPVLLLGALRVAGSDQQRDYARTSRALKLGMFAGIAAIVLGA